MAGDLSSALPRARAVAPPLLLAASLILAAHPARAWECTQTAAGTCLTWRTGCVSWSMAGQSLDNRRFESPAQPTISFEELHEAVAASFATWDDVECSYMSFVETDPMHCFDVGYHAGSGNANRVFFRSSGWLDDDAPWRESGQIALTSVFYDTETGQIFDVDIEFNAEEFEMTTTTETPRTDIQNALTHEVGHLLGLGHSSVRTATMAPSADLGETDKRELDPDDIEGVCTLYPLASDPGTCDGPAGGLDLECGDATWCAPTVVGITPECTFDELVCCCAQAGGLGRCGWDDAEACRTSDRHAVLQVTESLACPDRSPGPTHTCCCDLDDSGVSCDWQRISECGSSGGVPVQSISTTDLCGAPPDDDGCACAAPAARPGLAASLLAMFVSM